tara:strand:+ start:427 stop:2019 length:1593 start_codon:yes stop_codon:yes gene_type:complete
MSTKYIDASTPNKVVKLDANDKLPAVDGSQLTNIVHPEAAGGAENLIFNPTFAGRPERNLGAFNGTSRTLADAVELRYKNVVAPGWHMINRCGEVKCMFPGRSSNTGGRDVRDQTAMDYNNVYLRDGHGDQVHPATLELWEDPSSNHTNRTCMLTTYLRFSDMAKLKWGTADALDLTYSFWFKSTRAGTYVVEFCGPDNYTPEQPAYTSSYYNYGNPPGTVTPAVPATGANRRISKSFTVTTADTWAKYSVTIPGITPTLDPDFNDQDDYSYADWKFGNIQINLWLKAGTDYTSGTSLNDTWSFGSGTTEAERAVGVSNSGNLAKYSFRLPMLEAGSSASDFTYSWNNIQLAQKSYLQAEPKLTRDRTPGYARIPAHWEFKEDLVSSPYYNNDLKSHNLNMFNLSRYLSDGVKSPERELCLTDYDSTFDSDGSVAETTYHYNSIGLMSADGWDINIPYRYDFFVEDSTRTLVNFHIRWSHDNDTGTDAVVFPTTSDVTQKQTGTYYITQHGPISTNYVNELRPADGNDYY